MYDAAAAVLRRRHIKCGYEPIQLYLLIRLYSLSLYQHDSKPSAVS
jgi:hypothetical protein